MKKSEAISKIRSTKYDGGFLRQCPAELQDDEEVVVAAIERGYTQPVTGSYSKIVTLSGETRQSVMTESSSPFQFASARLQRDPEIALLALAAHGDAVFSIDKELLNDTEFVRMAAKINQIIFKHLPPALREDSEFMASFLRDEDGRVIFEVYENCPERLQNDEKLAYEVIEICPNLAAIPEAFRDNQQIVRRFLDFWRDAEHENLLRDFHKKKNILWQGYSVVDSFNAVSPRLRNQKEIREDFIRWDHRCFSVLSDEVKDPEEIQKLLKDSEEIQKILVESIQRGIAEKTSCEPYLEYFRFLDESDRTNPRVVSLFLGDRYFSWDVMEQKIMPFIPEEMVLNSLALWKELTRLSPSCLKNASRRIKRNPLVVFNAVRKDKKAGAYSRGFLRILHSINLLGFIAELFYLVRDDQ